MARHTAVVYREKADPTLQSVGKHMHTPSNLTSSHLSAVSTALGMKAVVARTVTQCENGREVFVSSRAMSSFEGGIPSGKDHQGTNRLRSAVPSLPLSSPHPVKWPEPKQRSASPIPLLSRTEEGLAAVCAEPLPCVHHTATNLAGGSNMSQTTKLPFIGSNTSSLKNLEKRRLLRRLAVKLGILKSRKGQDEVMQSGTSSTVANTITSSSANDSLTLTQARSDGTASTKVKKGVQREVMLKDHFVAQPVDGKSQPRETVRYPLSEDLRCPSSSFRSRHHTPPPHVLQERVALQRTLSERGAVNKSENGSTVFGAPLLSTETVLCDSSDYSMDLPIASPPMDHTTWVSAIPKHPLSPAHLPNPENFESMESTVLHALSHGNVQSHTDSKKLTTITGKEDPSHLVILNAAPGATFCAKATTQSISTCDKLSPPLPILPRGGENTSVISAPCSSHSSTDCMQTVNQAPTTGNLSYATHTNSAYSSGWCTLSEGILVTAAPTTVATRYTGLTNSGISASQSFLVATSAASGGLHQAPGSHDEEIDRVGSDTLAAVSSVSEPSMTVSTDKVSALVTPTKPSSGGKSFPSKGVWPRSQRRVVHALVVDDEDTRAPGDGTCRVGQRDEVVAKSNQPYTAYFPYVSPRIPSGSRSRVSQDSAASVRTLYDRIIPKDEMGEEDESNDDNEYEEDGPIVGFYPAGFDAKRGQRKSNSITFFLASDNSSSSGDDPFSSPSLQTSWRSDTSATSLLFPPSQLGFSPPKPLVKRQPYPMRMHYPYRSFHEDSDQPGEIQNVSSPKGIDRDPYGLIILARLTRRCGMSESHEQPLLSPTEEVPVGILRSAVGKHRPNSSVANKSAIGQ